MNAKLAKIISAAGLSTFKHTLGGVPLAAGYGFSYWEVVLYTAIGGIVGVGFFMLLASSFQSTVKKRYRRKKPKRTFTRKNRFIVKIKKNFGLAGIAFLTPWFLSIPLGTFISLGIYKSPRKVFLYQSVAIVFWSFLGAGLAQPIASLFLE
ncbi:MAG: hypothetical protein RLZZ519_1360 [Bacteroidota bacterium]|jgi:hypothetical protein